MLVKMDSAGLTASQLKSQVVNSPEASLESVDGTLRQEWNDKATLSSLASRLNESAVRAEKRDSELGREALAAKASEIKAQMLGPAYTSNRETYDSFIPDTNDAEWLERARQATDFIKATYNGSKSTAVNPFAGLSDDQLVLIAYDDSGAYTLNERQAASYETGRREGMWRDALFARADAAYAQTGSKKDFYQEIIDHYQALPAIEQARYPINYVAELQANMNRPNDPLPVNANQPKMKTLFDLLSPPREDLSESLPVTSQAANKAQASGRN